jgi:acetolactate synthase-1/2/3 large subunit
MVNRDIEPLGVDIFTPDFVAAAKALGCAAGRANDVEALRAALRQASESPLPTLIEIDQQAWMSGVAAC